MYDQENPEEGRKIEVSFTPQLYPVYKNPDSIVVVIDVFRATSAMCTAFEHGVEKIIPVETIEEARDYQEKGYLVGAERLGQPVKGFDFGNSPYSYMGENIVGKTIVLSTTNGTRAIQIAKDAHQVVIGSFVNLTALCEYLIKQERDVLLQCAGWQNRYNLEDALLAGAVAEVLSEDPAFTGLGDSALASKYLYQVARDNPYTFLSNSSHRRRLANLNLKKDIKYCLTPDQTSIVPVLKGDALVRLEE